MQNVPSSIAVPASQIDGADLLDELCEYIRRHVVIDDDAVMMIALWIVFTWVAQHSFFQPRLAITSPEPGCGKTTVLQLLRMLVKDAFPAANITPAALFRSIDRAHPTLLIDEADSFLSGKEELRGIINAGFERGGSVIRCIGSDFAPASFDVAGPLAIAAIGDLPNTISERSVAIEMRRKEIGVTVESLRVDKPAEAHALRDRIAQWASDIAQTYEGYDPAHMPALSSDRAADTLRPLIAIADMAGDHWPTKARDAARSHNERTYGTRTRTEGIRLLEDIRTILQARATTSIRTSDLLTALNALEESPWGELGRASRGLTAFELAKRLKPYKIGPATIRFGSDTAKGYQAADFTEAFRRYLAPLSSNP